jgi:hypothetical protein
MLGDIYKNDQILGVSEVSPYFYVISPFPIFKKKKKKRETSHFTFESILTFT